MKKFLVLVKKEIKELITPQMIIPLVIIVVAFSFIGNIMSKETEKAKETQAVWLVNEDRAETGDEVIKILEEANFKAVLYNENVNNIIPKAEAENIGGLIVIPAGFGDKTEAREAAELRIVSIISNFSLLSQSKTKTAQGAISVINSNYSDLWIKEKTGDIPPAVLKSPIVAKETVVIGERQADIPLSQVMGVIQKQTAFIPIILYIVIMVSAQMVAVAMANEKENKTFETLLSLPINRKTIIFAKLIGAGIVALLFASVYMIGFRMYLGGMAGGFGAAESEQVSAALSSLGVNLGTGSFILLGLSLFLGILVALAIAMILGIFVDDVKGIQAVITPLMIMVLLPYLLVLFVDFNNISILFKYLIYAIPFTHPFLAAQKVITHEYLFIIYGIIYELLVFVVFVILAAKIFSSDKILTLKLGKRKK